MNLFCNSNLDPRFIKFALISPVIEGCNIIEDLDIVFKVYKDEWNNEYLNICQILKNEKNVNEYISFATFYNHYNYTQGLKELILNKDLHSFFKIINSFKNYNNKVKLYINIYIDKTYLLNIYENNSLPELIYKIIIDNSFKIKNNGIHLSSSNNDKKKIFFKEYIKEGNILKPSYNIKLDNFKKKLFVHQMNNINWMIEHEKKISEDILDISYYDFDKKNVAKYYIDSIRENIYLDICEKKMYDIKKSNSVFLNLNGGILCDEVGLGKTFSMIGLISNDSEDKKTLVFTPRRLCKQWEEEINSTTNLKCFIVHSIKHISKLNIKMKDYKIIIIPYSILDNKKYKILMQNNKHPCLIHNLNWHRVILDESHEFINSISYASIERVRNYLNLIPSNYRWLCSGTPFSNIRDIQYIMNYLLKKCTIIKKNVKIYKNFESNDDLTKTFYIWEDILKIICMRNIKNKLNEIKIAETLIDVEFLEQSVIERAIYDSALNDKKKMIELCNHILISDNHIKILGNEPLSLKEIHNKMTKYYCQKKNKTEKRIINLQFELNKYKLKKYKSSAEKMLLDNFINTIKEKIDMNKKNLLNIQSKYKIFNSISENLDINKKCPICFENLDNLTKIVTVCGHFFCSRCILSTLKNNNRKCPICRENIIENQLEVILPENIYNDDKWGTKMSRMISYLEIILKDYNNRVIIFSQFDNMLHLVGKVLYESNIEYLFLNGSFNVINSKIRKFKLNSNIRVALLSSEKSASGLNLTEANHIILLDTHNAENGLCPIIEEQAIGRSVRIGQKKKVFVKRFVMKDTIEEDNYNNNVKIL